MNDLVGILIITKYSNFFIPWQLLKRTSLQQKKKTKVALQDQTGKDVEKFHMSK